MKNKLIFNPEKILTDFEQAAITAFGQFLFFCQFPKCFIFRLFFPFRKVFVQKSVLAMKTYYMTDDSLKIWFKSLIALALIPTRIIQDEFVDLLEKAQGMIIIIFNSKYF